MNRSVWIACLLALAACKPPPPTKGELLAKWGASYPACLEKYADADGATPPAETAACGDQFQRLEQIFTSLDTSLRIAPAGAGEGGAMVVTATNDKDSGRIYREFTIRIIFYPSTVKFIGEAGRSKTHEEFWTVRADIAPGETVSFSKQAGRALDLSVEHYFHFAYGAKFVSLK